MTPFAKIQTNLTKLFVATCLLTIPVNVTAIKHAKADTQTVAGMNTADLEKFIHDYLIENPDVVIDAITAYKDKEEKLLQASFKDQLAANADVLYIGQPMAGNPNGDVTVVEFFDYNCGYCKRTASDIQKLVKNDKNLRVVFKELPILSDSSRVAAKYALAAHMQGDKLYFDYHVALMESSGPKNQKNLEKIAKDVGLDVEKLKEDAKKTEINEALKANLELSKKLSIRGTPAFIIGDTLAPGAIGYDNLVEAITAERSK